jgi:transcriptional regulator with XRE-family HTH domain
MPRTTQTLRAGQSSPRCLGVVSGYLFKLMRESVSLTQVDLAELVSVDVATVQGWETGRRPLTALRASDLARLRMRLTRYGVAPRMFAVLSDAIEADLIIADAVDAGENLIEPDYHSLAAVVHRRDLTNLITWPFTGITPVQLRGLPQQRRPRRGPVADRPVLEEEEKRRFFSHLIRTADSNRDTGHSLLRRQATYLLGFDPRNDSAEWLAVEQRRALRLAGRIENVASWVSVRSSAIALARNGNKDPLREFVSAALSTETQELANLNYWAYWVGEIPETQANDSFMTGIEPSRWGGVRLFEHLLRRLQPGSDHADLNIHTLWTLLLARPGVLDGRPDLHGQAERKVEEAASDPDLAVQARQELASVAYAIRFAKR